MHGVADHALAGMKAILLALPNPLPLVRMRNSPDKGSPVQSACFSRSGHQASELSRLNIRTNVSQTKLVRRPGLR